MHFQIYTSIVEYFEVLNYSLLGKALKRNLWSYEVFKFPHRSDDTPYGGGAGMVLQPTVFDQYNLKGKILYMSPRGKVINCSLINKLLEEETIISIICCRYAGIDQRVLDHLNIEEISLGDFILPGGEIAAIALIEAIVRKIDGVIGNKQSLENESFEDYLLEHDMYTKPAVWNNRYVPDVLISGHHKRIMEWKKWNARYNTCKKRFDLWKKYKEHARIARKVVCNDIYESDSTN